MLIEKRLDGSYRALLAGMIERRTTTLKHIARFRAEEVRFGRFLRNKKVTPEHILQQSTGTVNDSVGGKHILLIEDSSELSFGLLPRAAGLGAVGNGAESGFYIHPVLAIDTAQRACAGLAGYTIFKRPELPAELQGADRKTRQRNWISQPFKDKSSYRWLQTALQAQKNCRSAARMTVVADREADIYEALDGFITNRLDFVIRMRGDRILDGPGQQRRRQQQAASYKRLKAGDSHTDEHVPDAAPALIATVHGLLDTLPVRGSYELALPATDKRSAHKATLEVKYTPVRLRRPQTATCRDCSPALDIYVVEVRERTDSVAGNEAPVHWLLLTTHVVETAAQALEVIKWYRWRWNIEQVFRLLKSRGMDIEQSGLQAYERLANLAAMALVAAVRVLQLVLARDDAGGPQLGSCFNEEQAAFVRVLNKSLEGGTAKQRNPYPPGSLAYGSWVIARLAGWSGYVRQPPGPITMHRGLIIFYQQFEGYMMAKNTS